MTQTAAQAQAMRANHCAQARAGYFYCGATADDPCGPGRYPHDGHTAGQCSDATGQDGYSDGWDAAVARFHAAKVFRIEDHWPAEYRDGYREGWLKAMGRSDV